MSEQLRLWDNRANLPEYGEGEQNLRAMLAREMRYLLAISTNTSGRGRIAPAGVVHSLGVCLVEDGNMARGAKKLRDESKNVGMPRFVDVKLTAEQRGDFLDWPERKGDLVVLLQDLADDGYRVGVSWSGEHQSYTVSLTGRADDSPNKGLCMTSFAGKLDVAIWLALFKHRVVTRGRWIESALNEEEDFG